jgi:hypothetical protein
MASAAENVLFSHQEDETEEISSNSAGNFNKVCRTFGEI